MYLQEARKGIHICILLSAMVHTFPVGQTLLIKMAKVTLIDYWYLNRLALSPLLLRWGPNFLIKILGWDQLCPTSSDTFHENACQQALERGARQQTDFVFTSMMSHTLYGVLH